MNRSKAENRYNSYIKALRKQRIARDIYFGDLRQGVSAVICRHHIICSDLQWGFKSVSYSAVFVTWL